MAVNRDRFLAMVNAGGIKVGDEVTITERTAYTVVSVGGGRIRLDRSEAGSHDSLMLNAQMPSKRLAEAEFDVTTPIVASTLNGDNARLREYMQKHMER